MTMAPHASQSANAPNASGPPQSAGLVKHPDSKLAEFDKSELALVDKFSSPDGYMNGEKDTCWHPWHDNLELKPLRFETRTGTFVVVLRSTEDVVETSAVIHILHGKDTEIVLTVSGSLEFFHDDDSLKNLTYSATRTCTTSTAKSRGRNRTMGCGISL